MTKSKSKSGCAICHTGNPDARPDGWVVVCIYVNHETGKIMGCDTCTDFVAMGADGAEFLRSVMSDGENDPIGPDAWRDDDEQWIDDGTGDEQCCYTEFRLIRLNN